MSTKNNGNTLEFWAGGKEYPVDKIGYDINIEERDRTDSSTNPNGMESVMGRAKRDSKIEGFLYTVDGTEVASGSLVADTKYRVSLGTITEGSITYPVGTIFTSAGTGTASGSNKVKPLGTIIACTAIGITVGGTPASVTSIKYNHKHAVETSTDSSTAAGEIDIEIDRASRGSSIEMHQRKEDADLLAANPTPQPVVITFGATQTITGTATFKKLSTSAVSKGGIVKASYDFTWQGVPTFSADLLAVMPPIGTSTPIKAVFAKGTTTDKGYTGTAFITGFDLTADVNSDVRVAYAVEYKGATTAGVVS